MTNSTAESLYPASSFVCSDGGRSESKRPKQRNDCTVIALALSTGTAYDIAYDYLAERGRKCSQGAFFPNRAADDEALFHTFKWVPLPAVKGERRMNPYKFCLENPEGRYVLKTARHVIAVVDGKILDTLEPYPRRCVYGYWEVQRKIG